MAYGSPSLLAQTDNWGAFLFFAGWCFLSAVYVYFCVPEIAGMSVEEIDHLFTGSWLNAHKQSKKHKSSIQSGLDSEAVDDRRLSDPEQYLEVPTKSEKPDVSD
jgi:hypothetical protein